MRASQPMRPLWLVAGFHQANYARRTVCLGFVAAVANYRANCHELSWQPPRNIVPTAMHVVQGLEKTALSLTQDADKVL